VTQVGLEPTHSHSQGGGVTGYPQAYCGRTDDDLKGVKFHGLHMGAF